MAAVAATMGAAAKVTMGANVTGLRIVGAEGLAATAMVTVTVAVKAAEVELVPVRFHRLL